MPEITESQGEVIRFLSENLGWRTPTEIGEKALGKSYGNASSCACRILKRLISFRIVEKNVDGSGTYRMLDNLRLTTNNKEEK